MILSILNKGRQKTLSVKWRQSTAETKFNSRRNNHIPALKTTSTSKTFLKDDIQDNNLRQESMITISPNSLTNAQTILTTCNSEMDLNYNHPLIMQGSRRCTNRATLVRRGEAGGCYLNNGKSDSC